MKSRLSATEKEKPLEAMFTVPLLPSVNAKESPLIEILPSAATVRVSAL
jgi:hypothetical protein